MKVLLLLIVIMFLFACQTWEKEDLSHMFWLNNSCISGDCDKDVYETCWCDPPMGEYCGCPEEKNEK